MEEKQIVQVDLSNEKHSDALLYLLNDYMLDEMGIGREMPEELGPKIIEGLKNHSGYLGIFQEFFSRLSPGNHFEDQKHYVTAIQCWYW